MNATATANAPTEPRHRLPGPHRDLRGQRAGHRLTQGDAVEEVRAVDPLAALHQVALHVADGGDRATEPDHAQPQE
jgi:hypothetical protein